MGEQDGRAGLGGYLRALRLSKGASLDEMAGVTKISAHQLEALESEQLRELPAPIFVKGFIRAYCAFLGEPPDRALELYAELGGPAVRPPAPRTRRERRSSSWLGHPIAVSGALVIVFGLGLIAVNHGVSRTPSSQRSAAVKPAPSVAPAPRTPEPAPVTPGPAPTAPVPGREPIAASRAREPKPAPPPAAVAPPAERAPERVAEQPAPTAPQRARVQHLVATTVEPTWIRVEVDGERVTEELLPPGSRREWSASDRFVLTVGNAGGIALELNGHPLPSLGPSGAVVRQLSITAPRSGP